MTRNRPLLSDDALLDLVQRQTLRLFLGGRSSGQLSCARSDGLDAGPADDLVCIGGCGFGVMAIIVAAARGFVITREQAVDG